MNSVCEVLPIMQKGIILHYVTHITFFPSVFMTEDNIVMYNLISSAKAWNLKVDVAVQNPHISSRLPTFLRSWEIKNPNKWQQ